MWTTNAFVKLKKVYVPEPLLFNCSPLKTSKFIKTLILNKCFVTRSLRVISLTCTPSNIIGSVALKVAFCFWENLHYWKQHVFSWIYQDCSTCLSRAFWSHTDLRQAFSGFKNPGSSLRTAAYRESLGHLGPKAETLFQGNLPLPCQRTEHS